MYSGKGVCAVCGAKTGRGKALCRKHWMQVGHWHRTQIGNAMRDEKDSGEGPDEDGAYRGEEYLQAVRDAVMSLGTRPAGNNCPLVTGCGPCECDLPRCPKCGYTRHDASFNCDHDQCSGTIPEV